MTFSVIIPAHNAAVFVRQALDSVRMQVCKDYELIVVCDACKDNTAEIAREYTDKVLEVDYSNEGLTRNAGIEAASGEWIIWIDDDDYLTNENVLADIKANLKDEDAMRLGFYWGGKGYCAPDDYVAVWTKCWRRSFIGDTRFENEWPVDWPFYLKMKEKNGNYSSLDKEVYYYNYGRIGSQSEVHGIVK